MHKMARIYFKIRGAGSCREFEGLAYDFLEGKLDDKCMKSIDKHMKLCPPCIDFMESYRRTRSMGQNDDVPEVPPEFKIHLKKMFCKYLEV